MRRNPNDRFDDIFNQIERMMEDMMGLSGREHFESENMTDTHVDIRETDDQLIVMADLPGVEKEDIELQCDGRSLTIVASNETRHYDERVRLPVTVDDQTANARYNNGVLEVSFERKDDSANINVE